MKRWRFAIIACALVVTLGNTDPDDACVKRTIIHYGDGFEEFQTQFTKFRELRLTALNLTDKSARKQEEKEKRSRKLNIWPAIPKESHGESLYVLNGQLQPRIFEQPDEKINVLSYDTNCKMLPYEIVKDDILGYPLPLPPYCNTSPYNREDAHASRTDDPVPRTAMLLSGVEKVKEFARSVGRLKVRSIDENKKEIIELWGTGFMVGDKTFATSCHVIAPLLKKDKFGNPVLNLDLNETLVVNFTPTDVPPNHQDDFEIKDPVQCSSHDGLDIALLHLDPGKGQLPPPPLPLFSGTIRDLKRANEKKTTENFWRVAVLIGYGDLLHPIDETTSEMYEPYEFDGYDDGVKVAMLDGIITEDECDDDLGIILDTVDTTVGESGSIVMDSLDWFNRDKPANPDKPDFVLGVHTCCSAYFGLAQYTTLKPDLRCARLNRTFHNQDISSRSILRDRALCPIIRDDHGKMVDDKGNKTAVTCDDLRWEWPLSWKTFYK